MDGRENESTQQDAQKKTMPTKQENEENKRRHKETWVLEDSTQNRAEKRGETENADIQNSVSPQTGIASVHKIEHMQTKHASRDFSKT